jgi:hypothetical protein
MNSARFYHWIIIVTFGIVFLVGCTNTGAQKPVLDRLPSPIYVDHQPSLAPQVAPTPRQEKIVIEPAMKEEPRHPWLPAGGITRRWEYVVIHHTASDIGSLKDVHQWHLDNGWEHGCGYDFVIGNGTRTPDGQIEVGPRWKQQIHGAHVRLSEEWARRQGIDSNHYNEHGIGIALVGDFEKDYPSRKQMASLVDLVTFLVKKCDIPVEHVIGHGDVDQTKCPGKHLSIPNLRGKVLKALGEEAIHANIIR